VLAGGLRATAFGDGPTDLRLPSSNRLEALKGDRKGIPLNRLNEIIRGRRGVSADTALRLAKLLGTSAESWLGLQSDWDLWHAARALRKAG
jgi:hypothetical protein